MLFAKFLSVAPCAPVVMVVVVVVSYTVVSTVGMLCVVLVLDTSSCWRLLCYTIYVRRAVIASICNTL